MKKSQLLYSLLLVFACGCQQKSPTDTTDQAKEGKENRQSDDGMHYRDSTMEVYSENAYTALADRKYKFPSTTDFEQIIEAVYHIDVKKAKFDDVYLSEDNGPVPTAVRQKNFIYIFDHYADAEPNVDHNLTFNLNNYLFHKNIESRNVLLSSDNDKEYLFDLVEQYGYADDEYLLHYVLDKKYKNDNFQKLGALVFIKKPDGSLEIRTKILNFIAFNANEKDVVLAKNMLLYCINLIDTDQDIEFSAAQKAKIVAFASNAIDPIYKKYHRINDQHWGTASILSYYIAAAGAQKWNETEAGYLKEKYYNLPNLAAMIAYANEFDSIGAPD